MDGGIKRAVKVWHRRAGKEKSDINHTAKEMFRRVGAYYYIFPTYRQGNRVLWEGMDKSGFRFMDHIPLALRKRTDQTKMFIETVNGSTFQIIGSDNIDSIVGANPVGVVFSEFSLQDPQAWDYIRPILAENGGWAIFNFTPRGKNHAYDLLEYAKNDPNWYVSVLSVEDTKAITPEVLEQERKEIIAKNGDDAIFLQEYYCSFEASVQGSYYGAQLAQAEKEGRIKRVPYDPAVKVDTWWDLGVGDAMSIICTQSVGREVHLIDYIEGEGEGIPYYMAALQQKGYVFGQHYWPHDGEARELSTGVSRKETAEKLGLSPINIVENIGLDDGIQATRLFLSRCWIDSEKCKRLIDALKSYHKEYDEKRKVYKNKPEHDWSSHPADAARYMSVGHAQYKDVIIQPKRPKANTKLTKWG
jgi:hypothetical protein